MTTLPFPFKGSTVLDIVYKVQHLTATALQIPLREWTTSAYVPAEYTYIKLS